MISFLFFFILVAFLFIAELIPVIFCLFNFRIKKKQEWLPVSILIPVRNEEKIIEKVIKNWLDTDYPEKEIIFCDHSSDNTPLIIKKWSEKYPFIKYLRTDTGSKLGNVLMGARGAKYSLVLINDADKYPRKDSVKIAVPFLVDGIGAVFGKTVPAETKTIFQVFTSYELMQKYIDQKFYSNIDSVPYLSLCNCIIRKKDLIDIAPQQLIADDVYLAVKLREKNLRCIFFPEIEGVEEFAGNLADLARKRFRVSQGTSEIAMAGYLGTMFNGKFGNFGKLVVPLRQLYFLGINFALVSFLIVLMAEKLFGIIGYLTVIEMMVGLYLILFFIYFIRVLAMPLIIKYNNNKFIFASFFYPFYYIIFFRLISSFSLIYYLFKKHSKTSYWR